MGVAVPLADHPNLIQKKVAGAIVTGACGFRF
jgi:hypothetical protein